MSAKAAARTAGTAEEAPMTPSASAPARQKAASAAFRAAGGRLQMADSACSRAGNT